MATFLDEVRTLCERLQAESTPGSATADAAAQLRRSLDEPLRVAIAGRLKAGKSTLLNALVADELAPTDAGECTSIVTWYRDGGTYRVLLEPRDGEPRQVRFTKEDGAIDVDLGGTPAEDVRRLVVDWPSQALRHVTLIDTPGIGSINAATSARTIELLTPDDERAKEADAVLYLMRHVHTSDVRFLEAFHDDELVQATPVNAIGLLSRADEIGAARLDAMASSRRIAERYRADPKVRRLCFTVLPIAGLLAMSAATLREPEFQAFRALARAPVDEVESSLRSVDRFVADHGLAGLTPIEREDLLARFGIFGVRLAVDLVRSGQATTARALAELLADHSGLLELRQVLAGCFAARADVLKARRALLAVEQALRNATATASATASADVPTATALLAEVERIRAGAHELAETRLLGALRSGAVTVKDDEVDAVERLLGASGPAATARLGLPADAPAERIREHAADGVDRWRRRAESPLAGPADAEAARTVVRTYEGILAALA
jgi:hypothetical protein